MEQEEIIKGEYKIGKQLMLAILIGKIALELCNIGFAAYKGAGYLGAIIGAVLWSLLLWRVYKGAVWARYTMIVILWLSLVPSLAVLGVIVETLANGYSLNIYVSYILLILVIVSMGYDIVAAIILSRSEKVKDFLNRQSYQ